MNFIKNKKFLIFFSLIILVFSLYFIKTNLASAKSKDPIIREALKYRKISEDNIMLFDIDKAKKDNASEEAIKILEVAKDIYRNYFVNTDKDSEKVLYGNYVGIGNKGWDKDPIDELDAAFQNHDRCYSVNGDNKACNYRLTKALNYIIEYGGPNLEKIIFARASKLVFDIEL